MEDDDRAKYLFLSLLQARVGSSLVSHLGNLTPEAVLQTPVVELAGRAKISSKAREAFEELQRGFDPERMLESLAARGIEALTPVDEAYPGSLRSIPDPPPALFVNGAIPGAVSVALVGSRKASATGIETARALGLELAERGVCVVSGLALGVDAAAHEGALEACGLTVGVLGCGIDVTYPTKYKRLRAALPRSALQWAHAAIGSNESLTTEHKLPIASFTTRSRAHRISRSVCAAVYLYSVVLSVVVGRSHRRDLVQVYSEQGFSICTILDTYF
ncbi:MAG: DNA-protecting protein DprA [Actinomycetota bacterium]|nr:DNA-protecting protein DprA [Actinomycetota bacterium]